MGSKDEKRAALNQQLRQLRSATNSTAVNFSHLDLYIFPFNFLLPVYLIPWAPTIDS